MAGARPDSRVDFEGKSKGKETEMGMLDDLKVMKRAMTGYLWKRWDMFWLGINGRTEAAFAEAELGNDEERYYWIWFRAIMPEGSAWWHT
nr:hypothetical protein [uncultured Acetatifactor sp.]